MARKSDIDKKNNMIMVIPDCQFDNSGLSNVYEPYMSKIYIKLIDIGHRLLHCTLHYSLQYNFNHPRIEII